MKRITPDEVVEAYHRTGWRPIQDAYYDEIDGNPLGEITVNTARTAIYEAARAKAIKEWLVEAKALVAAAKQPKPATEDDGYANPDDYVDRMGRYYSSEYVAVCKPWERKLPFEEWLERRRIGEARKA